MDIETPCSLREEVDRLKEEYRELKAAALQVFSTHKNEDWGTATCAQVDMDRLGRALK